MRVTGGEIRVVAEKSNVHAEHGGFNDKTFKEFWTVVHPQSLNQ